MNFRNFLKKELSERCKKNPSYSLRAFALQLSVSHTTLSQVLSGKRPLTPKAQKRMALSLGITAKEFARLSKNARLEGTFEKLELDRFEVLTEWYYDAILELTHLKIFKPDIAWIARILEMNHHQVADAVERLLKLKLLIIDENGNWQDATPRNTNNHLGDFTNIALKGYQKSVLERSLQALDAVPRRKRDHSSLTLTFPSSKIDRAKEMIKAFRAEFLLENDEPGDSVYILGISFFPVTKLTSKDKS